MNFDIEKMTKLTAAMIGYDNFKKERKMKRKKLQIAMCIVGMFCFLSIGTIGVNAVSDNAIVDGVKNIKEKLKIKLNGEPYKNAECSKTDNGYVCHIDEEGYGEIEIEQTDEYDGDLEFDFEMEDE